MSKKNSRDGGKFTGNHTTLIPAAIIACDIANALPEVTKITPGFIKSGLKPANGKRRVKLTEKGGNCILLSVRDNKSHQEVFVYVTDLKAARIALARDIEEAGLGVSFRKDI